MKLHDYLFFMCLFALLVFVLLSFNLRQTQNYRELRQDIECLRETVIDVPAAGH